MQHSRILKLAKTLRPASNPSVETTISAFTELKVEIETNGALEHLKSILAIFCGHLMSKNIPTTNITGQKFPNEILKATLALAGLSAPGTFMVQHPSAVPADWKRDVHETWLKILPHAKAWISYFLDAVFPLGNILDPTDMNTRRSAWTASVNLLYHLHTHETAQVALIDKPSLLAALWHCESDHLDLDPSSVPTYEISFPLLLALTKWPEAELVSYLGGDAQKIARTAMDHVSRAATTATSTSDGSRLVNCLQVLYSIIPPTHKLHSAFTDDQRLARLSLQLVNEISNRRDFQRLPPTVFLILPSTLRVLKLSFNIGDGIPVCIIAIEMGILGALFKVEPATWETKCANFPSGSGDDDLANSPGSILETLACHSRYLSVLLELVKTIDAVPPDALSKCKRQGGSFWDKWIEFLDIVSRRRDFHTNPPDFNDNTRCHSLGCTNRNPRVNYQRCAGCEKSIYCSKECQRHDWEEEGHKTICKEWNQLGIYKLSAKDKRFVRKLTEWEKIEMKGRIIDAWNQLAYPSHPFAELDYSTLPAKLTYGMIRNYHDHYPWDVLQEGWSQEARSLEWPAAVRKVESLPRAGILIRLYYQGNLICRELDTIEY